MIVTRAELHKLLDEVPDARVDSVGVVLRRVVDDPEVARLLTIPWDDEPVSEAEDRLVAQARQEPSVPLDELLRDLDH